jgi:hypothetical protein
VDDRTRVLVATVAGAVAGGVFGFLYLTEAGRRFRDRVEPGIDEFVAEVRRLKRTVEKARAAADESWRTLQEVARSR